MSSSTQWLIISLLLIAAVAGMLKLWWRGQAAIREREQLVARFRGVVDADAEEARVRASTRAEQEAARARLEAMADDAEARKHAAAGEESRLRRDVADLELRQKDLEAEIALLDEQVHVFSFGLYTPQFDCSSSIEYAARLERVRDEQKALLRGKRAAVGDAEWTVNGSKAEGRKQINQTLKLMLRAFNGECDAAVAKVRYNNINVMDARIKKAWETINSLAQVQQCRITSEYLQRKLEELYLEFEYEEKVHAEKEEQRRIREQMREEEIARREIEKARADAEDEERRAERALEKARGEVADAVGAKQARLQAQIEELERRLTEAHERKERAISRAQLTRSGHVYVISNIGSFGEHVYKIGMTRRLDPLERIKELGDASVPFDFDIHAVIYADDAPALENELHRAFTRHRVNRINERKEFFQVSIEAIADAVRQHRGDIEITLAASAPDYRKTLALLEKERAAGRLVPPPLAAVALPIPTPAQPALPA